MMGKRLTIAFAFLLVLLTGCESKPELAPVPETPPAVTQPGTSVPEVSGGETAPEKEEHPSLIALREEITDEGRLFGVAYLGYVEGTYSEVCAYQETYGLIDAYPFLADMVETDFVDMPGGELYLIVPGSKDVSLTIREQLIEAEGLKAGEQLMEITDGRPVLFRGNVSDIVPNILITARKQGMEDVEYSPCLSLRSGLLQADRLVWDATEYNMLSVIGPEYGPTIDYVCYGPWYGRGTAANGELMAIYLEIDSCGRAVYRYGYPESEVLERYVGEWYADGDELQLELYGGPVGEDGCIDSQDIYLFSGTFRWENQGNQLTLTHTFGNALLRDTDGETCTFMSFNGFPFVGDWRAEQSDCDVCYDLSLCQDGSAAFVLSHMDGEFIASYLGWWWYTEEGFLDLTLDLDRGTHFESPDLMWISGSYEAERTEEDRMTLTYLGGEILTLGMEESTVQEFVKMEAFG